MFIECETNKFLSAVCCLLSFENGSRKTANFRRTFKYKHFLTKPTLEDDLCNFTDVQYKSLYKSEVLFGN